MTVLVIDASVLAVALLDNGDDGARVRARISGESLAAPSLVDLEVISVWRGLARGRKLSQSRLDGAVEDLIAIPIKRVGHTALLRRCWELRDNLSAYDAAYVALAELLGATLLTADGRLARASGPTCRIELVVTA